MKPLGRLLATAALALASAFGANAQYYQMANQLTNMLSTALSGGFMYRGMADVSYQRGLGDNRVNFFEITTTQGVKYANWFYMGVGAGVDILNSDIADSPISAPAGSSLTQTACMVPLYSDFRFNIGAPQKTSLFIDLRIGASFLIGSDRLQVGSGYINRSECFYLRPSLGMRIPVSASNPKLAVNVGACYTLVCTDYWYSSYSKNINLSALGLNVGFEW